MRGPSASDPLSQHAYRDDDHGPDWPKARRCASAYDDILAPSFPFDELEPFDVFAGHGRGRPPRGPDRAGRGRDRGRRRHQGTARHPAPCCSATTRRDRTAGAPGYGSQLYRALLTSIVDELQPSLVLGEVAHPDYHEPHPRHGDPLARLRFYGRFDARIIDVPYFQASLGPGLQPVYGLLLLALYVRPDLIDPARSRLDNPENLLAALRTMLEWDGEPDDASAARLLTVASQGRVRLVPVEEYRQVVPGLKR